MNEPQRPDQNALPPLVCHEDEHLLVVNKPPGWNTHAPDPYAGEGIYDWLRAREPRWAKLAIIHRLDKETSGILLFSKTRAANQSLTRQFSNRTIDKRYLLLTDRPVKKQSFELQSNLLRLGAKYVSRPQAAGGQDASTHFRVIKQENGRTLLEAHPVTGRTHQIRVHAADAGLPILGDALYGGSKADRLCLHAKQLTCEHPATGQKLRLTIPEDFSSTPNITLRRGMIVTSETTAYRLIHGASDRWPGWYVDRLGDYVLSQSSQPLSTPQRVYLQELLDSRPIRGIYHKRLTKQISKSSAPSPTEILGERAPAAFEIQENGLRFEMSFAEGYSTGLFLDQRDNRRKLLTNHVAPGLAPLKDADQPAEVLNTFAYTCGFSVCAARAGARVTSIDLSRKYLEWGKRNFTLNNLSSGDHDFIYGEVFDWLRRFAKRGREFDLVLLDPPTFSRSKESGTFQAEKDYGKLVEAAVGVIKPGGTLFCSTNAARLDPAGYIEGISTAIRSTGRSLAKQHYGPQPPDFPITRAEPAHLKTVWLTIS